VRRSSVMRAMRCAVLAAGCALGACAGQALAGEADLAVLEKQFVEMPMEARRLTGPLFWLHGTESRERLEMYLEKVAEGHNGTFTAESRPHNDWLGPRWYEDLAICLQAAKKHDLTMWIFDEKWWPSQMLGGKVPPEYGTKVLVADAAPVDGPKTYAADGFGGPRFIGAVAGKEGEGGAIDGDSLVDLARNIKGGTLTWGVPAGKWKIMKFTWAFAGAKGMQKKWISVDGASRDCVEWFLKTVYQPHYDRFKDDFGKTIKGYFYDEPETQGDWGTEVMKMLAKRKIDWKKPFVAWKFRLAGDEQAAAKYQYQDAFAEAWGRTLYGGMSEWCRAHKVISMGHFMEHDWEYLSPQLCAGNMFQLMKYSDMGGIDLVCRQFYPGQKKMGLWQMAKLGSSITHVYAKPDDVTMCEMFGAYGQDITYLQMKWLTDQMQVRGVNFMIPHSFNPKSPYDTDCPPYFYNGGYEPRWPLYRVYADYTNRLSLLLSGGRHVAPVAILFLGNSRHVGKAVPPEQITTSLDDALFDSDWMPYDVFENDAKLAGKEISLHQERYRVLVVPPVEVIPYGALAKAKALFDAGGIVVGHGFLPSKSATLGKTSQDIAALRDAVWGAAAEPGLAVRKTSPAGGRSYLLPEKPTPEDLRKVLAGDAGIHPALEVIEGETNDWVHVLHRVKAGRDVFLICNQNHEGQARRLRFRAAAAGVPEHWDPMRNEISSLPHKRTGESVEFELVMEPNESALVVFTDGGKVRPPRIETLKPLRPAIDVVREPLAGPQPPSRPTKHVGDPAESTRLTVSPITADVFGGRCEIPADIDLAKGRAVLMMDDVPQGAAAVTVNGQDAGGVIGGPYRLDVTRHVRKGANVVTIAPLAPKFVRLLFYAAPAP